MSDIRAINKNEPLFEQASLWLARIERELTPTERRDFELWLAKNPKNKETLFKMAKMWDKMGDLQRLAEVFPIDKDKFHVKKQVRWATAIAASLVLVFSMVLMNSPGFKQTFSGENKVIYSLNINTPMGVSSTTYLPDNTKVILNTNSLARVTYTNSYRLLELIRGELHVDVSPDKSRPLSVVANNQIIQAVGTAFNVKIEQDIVELIVTEGKVVLGSIPAEEKIEKDSLQIPAGTMTVSRGEIVSLDRLDRRSKKISDQQVSASLSWQQGNLVFAGETLQEALQEVSRYTNVKFEITTEELKQLKIAGRFKTDDVKGLMNAISSNFDVQIEQVGMGRFILSPK